MCQKVIKHFNSKALKDDENDKTARKRSKNKNKVYYKRYSNTRKENSIDSFKNQTELKKSKRGRAKEISTK